MTDKEKLEKVKAEIERRRDRHSKAKRIESALEDNAILSFIDSMQEESKVCMYSTANYTDEDRKALCDGCEEECKYASNIPPVFDEGYWERLGEKPVSEDLEAILEEKKFKISDTCLIQYASREAGIKAHAEDYSFNIESMLFQQLTPEQQKLWRKEIEQAVLSGGYCGLELANDRRYDKQEPVSEDLESFVRNYREKYWYPDDIDKFIGFAKQVANWQKQKMLTNAVDGFVIEDIEEGNGDFLLSAEYLPKDMGLKNRQKVKVIVIKED